MNFARAFVAVVFALVSVPAFAQYGTWGYDANTRQWMPPSVPVNNQQQFVNNGSNFYGGHNGGVVYHNQPYTVSQPGFGYGGPIGGGLTDCQLYGAIAGGTLGSLAKHHTVQAAILGMIGGGAAGNAICRSNSGQYVVVQQNQQGQIVQGTQQRHFCSIAGRTFEVAPTTSCLAIDDAVRAAAGQQPAQQQSQPGPANASFWGYHHPNATASNKMLCFATKQIQGMPPQCSSVKVEPANANENELQWRARVANMS